MLGARAAKSELFGQVRAESASDEEQCFAITDRLPELAVGAGEHRRPPCLELIRLLASREKDGVPAVTSQLAFELARPYRRDRRQRSQAEQVEAFELLGVEWKLSRGKRSEKGAGVTDLEQTPGSCAGRGKARRERAWRETEPWLASDRLQKAPAHLTYRFAWSRHTFEVDPDDTVVSHLDHRRQVVKRSRDELTYANGRFLVGEDECRLRAKMLGVAHRHPGCDAERHRLFRRRHHVLVPAADDDRRSIQVRPPGELEVIG